MKNQNLNLLECRIKEISVWTDWNEKKNERFLRLIMLSNLFFIYKFIL
jgi:hypothetical protein